MAAVPVNHGFATSSGNAVDEIAHATMFCAGIIRRAPAHAAQ